MKRRSASDPPERGDLVQVDWVDIQESISGDPEAAVLCRRTSFGLFWAKGEDEGIPVVITTTTIDHDEDIVGQNGYCCYPEAVIRKLTIIKRGRKSKKPETKENPPLV